MLVLIGGVVGVAVVVALVVGGVALTSGRGEKGREGRRERGREGGDESEAAALEQSGLPEAAGRLGFAATRHAHFTRGDVQLHGVVRRSGGHGGAVLDSVDVRVLVPSLAFAGDFVGRAKRGRGGELHVDARLEVAEGSSTARRDASARDREHFSRVVGAHLGQLDALSWASVEVFNHRAPRVHVTVRAGGPGELGEQVARAVAEAEALAADLRMG